MLSRRSFIEKCVNISAALACSGLVTGLSTAQAAERRIPVLAYHRVGYSTDMLTVTPEKFVNDLQALKRNGYTAITLDQMQTFVDERPIELPEKPVLITFDDGYVDNYEHAFPLLKQHGMVGSFFVISGLLWTDNRLSPAQVLEMSRAGMSIGSHTDTHRALGELSPQEMYDEMMVSKTILESVTGRTITSIAYPLGSYNEAVIKTAEKVGYNTGFTVKSGLCVKTSPDYELKRIPVFKYDGGVMGIMAQRGGL